MCGRAPLNAPLPNLCGCDHATMSLRSLAGSLLTGVLPVFSFQDEFSLGEWDRSAVTGEGENLIRHDQGADGEAGAIVLEVRFFHVRNLVMSFRTTCIFSLLQAVVPAL